MGGLVRFAKSSIGAKIIMAITGVMLVGFVFAHMAGNFLIYAGQNAMNTYAATLKGMPGLLWTMRLGILAGAALHIASGLRLARLNRVARPDRYAVTANRRSTMASRLMALSGLVLLAFIIYHLLHFTAGQTHPEHFSLRDAQGRHDVYSMFVMGFQQPLVSASYIVAMVLLAMHLKHGIASMFQSLGLTSPKYAPVINKIGPVLAFVVAAGNISMPVAVMSGVITTGAETHHAQNIDPSEPSAQENGSNPS